MSTVNCFAVLSPSVSDPDSVPVTAEVVKLDWMFAKKEDKELIDTIAGVDEQLKALEKWIKAAREVLKTRLKEPEEAGQETVTYGQRFEAHYVRSNRSDIDRDSVRKDMGDIWYAEHCKITPILTLKIVPITQTPGMVKEEGV